MTDVLWLGPLVTDVLWLGKPVPWKRTLGSGKRRYTDPVYRAWKDEFGWAAKAAHAGPAWGWPVVVGIQVGPDGIRARFVPLGEDPSFDSVPLVERPKGLRADIDNYIKGVLDSVQKVVITDDRLVVAVRAAFVDTVT